MIKKKIELLSFRNKVPIRLSFLLCLYKKRLECEYTYKYI